MNVMKKGRTLALFDFDGTITNRDTFIDFFKFVYGNGKIWILSVKFFPFIILYFLKMYSGRKLKELFLKDLIKGWDSAKFEKEAVNYYENRLKSILKHSAMSEIEKLKAEGAKIVVVTASAEEWVKPFSNHNGIDLVATKLEMKNGFYTGKILGQNCRGEEKVRRISEKYDKSLFDTVLAYGDSSGDKEMLEFATRGFYRIFY
ncbi:MAG TPA: HAD-IB family hydrolase [bacterium]|nr:HAD-IB family hydrolase [bacterium]